MNFTGIYIRALHALLDGNEEAAIELLREEIQKEPGNFHAYLRLGILLRKKGNYNRAIQVHLEQTVRPRLGRKERKQLMYELALDYVAAGRNNEAEEALLGILGFDKGNTLVHQSLFRIYEEAERWEDSFATLQELYRKRNKNGSSMLARYRAFIGRTYLEAGLISESESQFRKGMRLDSSNLAVLYHYGDFFAANKKWNKAISFWKKLIELSPGSIGIVLSKLEHAYFESGKYEKFLEYLEKQLENNPLQTDLLLAIARLYHRKGRKEEAFNTINGAIAAEPLSLSVRRMKIEFLSEDERLGEAVRESLECFRNEPNRYECPWCGSKFEEYFWRCPSCLRWETLKRDSLADDRIQTREEYVE